MNRINRYLGRSDDFVLNCQQHEFELTSHIKRQAFKEHECGVMPPLHYALPAHGSTSTIPACTELRGAALESLSASA